MKTEKNLPVPQFQLKTPLDTIIFFGVWGWFLNWAAKLFGVTHTNMFTSSLGGAWRFFLELLSVQVW